MTQARRWILILALSPCLLAAQSLAGDVNLFYGKKDLGDDLLAEADVDGQAEFGVQLTLDFDWPVGLAVDVLSSSSDSTIGVDAGYPLEYTTDVSTLELDIGVRKIWGERLKPFVGGGVAWIRLDAEQTVYRELVPGEGQVDTLMHDSDNGLGYWLDAGLMYQVGRSFNVGLDVRYSNGSATLQPTSSDESVRFDSGGMHYGVMVGYHW